MNIESLPVRTRKAGVGCSLSLVIPAYNEADVIAAAIQQVVESLRSQSPDFEILVVDDDSTDGTATKADAMARKVRGVSGAT